MNIKRKWIEVLYNVATGSRKMRNLFTPIGAFIYGLLIFIFVIIALQVDRLLSLTAVIPDPFHIILSLPIFLLALFLIGWSVLNFIRVKGTPSIFLFSNDLQKIITNNISNVG
jgi:hypothetical protein